MSKHKLYIPDECSPFCLGTSNIKKRMTGNLTTKKNDNQPGKSKTSKTPEQGFKQKSLITTPLARKNTKKRIDSVETRNENHPALLSQSETFEPSTSKNVSPKTTTAIQKVEKLSPISVAKFIPDFDADDSDFITKFNPKLPYTFQEDEMIVKYVLKGQNIFKVSSLSLWRYLEVKKKNPKRTYQSLKNRFLRNIKPNLFTIYKHLIINQNTAEKILIKFPELKRQIETRRFLSQITYPELGKEISVENQLSSKSDECEINGKKALKLPMPPSGSKPEDFDESILTSPFSQAPKERNSLRNVEFSKNVIKISVNFAKCVNWEVPFAPLLGLSERFKKLKKNTERIPCPTCGRFYRRPVSNHSESDGESDVLIPDSVETDKNSDPKNVSLVSNKSPREVTEKMSLRSLNNCGSQNLLITLEKSDKSYENSEESNLNISEEVFEKDMIKEIITLEDIPLEKRESEAEEKGTDTDSDIDLIYENTVARFHKLIDADEEKTLQRKCLNKDRDSIGFNANAEKNLEAFFLETPMEETPALTNDFPTQVQVNSTKTQSQRITRSSALASNMIKMLARKTESGKG